tara:strand:- start:219 stop:467 length:249 start_codon:yes stop_codon:yes gene_type:complete
MDFIRYVDNPPAGQEQLAFALRQAAGRVDQLQENYKKHLAEGEQLRAQINHASGAADALKALAIQMSSDSPPADDAGDGDDT